MLSSKAVSLSRKELSNGCFGAHRPSAGRVPRSVQPAQLYLPLGQLQLARQAVIVAAAPQPTSQPATPRAYKKKVKKLVDMNGEVVKDLGNGMFQLKLENGVKVISHLSGRIRQAKITIVLGDTVTVELSPYDLTRGRITYRFKAGELEARKAAAAAAAERANADKA